MESSQPLVDAYDSLLLDLDGVIYVGHQPVAHAVEVLDQMRGRGVRLCFVTNNASRPPEDVAQSLTDFGINAVASDVITSAQAGAALMAEQVPAGSTILAVGGPGVKQALLAAGFQVIDALTDPPIGDHDDVAGVLQGFGRDVAWKTLARATFAVARGLPWIATNTDLTIPLDQGIAPGNGTLVNAVAAATGRQPEVAGKPFPPLLERAGELTRGLKPLVVGDRLDTDIEGAGNASMASALVLTGVTKSLALWRASAQQRPRHLIGDLRGLMVPPHLVARESDRMVCGAATAWLENRALQVRSGGDPVAGIWAVAHLLWEEDVEPDNAPEVAADLDMALIDWIGRS